MKSDNEIKKDLIRFGVFYIIVIGLGVHLILQCHKAKNPAGIFLSTIVVGSLSALYYREWGK